MVNYDPYAANQSDGLPINTPSPVNGQVFLADYDPAWPAMFAREAKRIRSILGDRVLLLEHTGSTSVPGLCAKPCIDMIMAVADSADEDAYVAPLEAAGYLLRIREPAWHEHRVFKGPDQNINLHVFTAGDSEIDEVIEFRTWLREHPDDRELYAATKRALAAQTWEHIQQYADAKDEVVGAIKARMKAGRTDGSTPVDRHDRAVAGTDRQDQDGQQTA